MAGKQTRSGRLGAVLAAVLGAIATALVGSLIDKKHGDAGDYVVMGVVIAVLAVGCGVGLAKAIGRQGKI